MVDRVRASGGCQLAEFHRSKPTKIIQVEGLSSQRVRQAQPISDRPVMP